MGTTSPPFLHPPLTQTHLTLLHLLHPPDQEVYTSYTDLTPHPKKRLLHLLHPLLRSRTANNR